MRGRALPAEIVDPIREQDVDHKTKAAMVAALGGTSKQAAEVAGVSERSVDNWEAGDATFQALVEDMQQRVRTRSRSSLHGMVDKALAVIEQVLDGTVADAKHAAIRADLAIKVLKGVGAIGVDLDQQGSKRLTIVTYQPRPGREPGQQVPGGMTEEAAIAAHHLAPDLPDAPVDTRMEPAEAVGAPDLDYLRALAEQDPDRRRLLTEGDFPPEPSPADALEARWQSTPAVRRTQYGGGG